MRSTKNNDLSNGLSRDQGCFYSHHLEDPNSPDNSVSVILETSLPLMEARLVMLTASLGGDRSTCGAESQPMTIRLPCILCPMKILSRGPRGPAWTFPR